MKKFMAWWTGMTMTMRVVVVVLAILVGFQARGLVGTATGGVIGCSGGCYKTMDGKDHKLGIFSTPPASNKNIKIPCPQCNAGGWHNCQECNGSGWGAPATSRTGMCQTCLGMGCTRCPMCRGAGGR